LGTWRAVVGAVIAVAVLVVSVVWFEEAFIYFPSREEFGTPADHGLDYHEAYLTTADGVRVHGWHVPARGPLTLLWFHGNAGHVGHRLEQLALIHERLGVGLFLLDYRGYGRSEGRPSEQGTYRDASAALAYLRAQREMDPEGIVLYGQSLGCAVAVELATRGRVRGLILEAPFASVPAVARAIYPFLPVGPFIRNRYDSLSRIARVGAPVLILHSEHDEIVPYAQGRALFAAAAEPKRFYTILSAGHNDPYYRGGSGYWQALREFLAELSPAPRP